MRLSSALGIPLIRISIEASRIFQWFSQDGVLLVPDNDTSKSRIKRQPAPGYLPAIFQKCPPCSTVRHQQNAHKHQ